MKTRYLFSLFFLIMFAASGYAQTYKGTVEGFYKALGKRDFASAYQLCTGKHWNTLADFSGNKMYGGIYEVNVSSIIYQKQTDSDVAEVKVDVFVKDSVNGDGRYIQNFSLIKKGSEWLIQRINLLKTSRAENGWNLKLVDQEGLTNAIIKSFLQPIYNRKGKKSSSDNIGKLERTINNPRFFQSPAGIYAVVVVQNQWEGAIANIGWCDAFVFEQKDKQWKLTDFKLKAGGGGMYGNSGGFGNLIQAGDQVAALVIGGGQMHLGDFTEFDDIIAIENGKLYDLVSIGTMHRYGEFGSNYEEGATVCEENTYRFIKSDKKNYDLQIIRTSCLKAKYGKELTRAIIPCVNKKYELPKTFRFRERGS